jgi:hypothetical protein
MIAAIADGSAPISKKDDSYMQSRASNMAVVLMAEVRRVGEPAPAPRDWGGAGSS